MLRRSFYPNVVVVSLSDRTKARAVPKRAKNFSTRSKCLFSRRKKQFRAAMLRARTARATSLD
jgi:hypothetical protein